MDIGCIKQHWLSSFCNHWQHTEISKYWHHHTSWNRFTQLPAAIILSSILYFLFFWMMFLNLTVGSRWFIAQSFPHFSLNMILPLQENWQSPHWTYSLVLRSSCKRWYLNWTIYALPVSAIASTCHLKQSLIALELYSKYPDIFFCNLAFILLHYCFTLQSVGNLPSL